MEKSIIHKRKIYVILTAMIFVVVVAFGTVLVIKFVNDNNSQKQTTLLPTKSSANLLKTQAINALKANNKAKARTLFIQANQQYKALGDKNNIIDTEAQIYLIDHAR